MKPHPITFLVLACWVLGLGWNVWAGYCNSCGETTSYTSELVLRVSQRWPIVAWALGGFTLSACFRRWAFDPLESCRGLARTWRQIIAIAAYVGIAHFLWPLTFWS